MADTETQAPPNGTQPLAPAPEGVEPPKQVPLNYRAEFLIETAEGFHVAVTGEALTPRDVFVWVRNASKQLADQGFKPVRRDLVIDLPAPVAASAPGAVQVAGEATLIKTGDGPPRCSLHGPMKWIEGDKDGRHYAFWGCSVRGCKPKEKAA